MIRLRSRGLLATTTILALMASTGCGHESASPAATPDARESAAAPPSVDAMLAHLRALQEAADASGGTRVAGSAGYAGSRQYVVESLRRKGFDVTTPEFTMGVFEVQRESLRVRDRPVEAHAVDFSGNSPAGGVTGPLVPVGTDDDAPGCSSSDYDELDVDGAVVLVDRGGCYLSEKVEAAGDAGAAALVIANDVPETTFSSSFTQAENVEIPVLSVTEAVGAALRGESGPATVVVASRIENVTTNNVIAQTTTGSTKDVVVVGAHLDSVRAGPGINDNGSGVAAVLETALRMGPTPDVTNAVRFTFWGGEEEGLLGSEDYVRSLTVDGLTDIALYLNFDMVASPNTCYFVTDGDESLGAAAPPVPAGSAGIERTLAGILDDAGKTPENVAFDGLSDYDGFLRAGVPVGNFATGADEVKTAAQARAWGGTADRPCDPNYHSAGDTSANVNREALALGGAVVAEAVDDYARDQSGPNGVPAHDERERHPLPPG